MIRGLLEFFDTAGQNFRLNMNMTKTKVQALNGTTNHVFSSRSGCVFNTVGPLTGLPRESYKYLGVFMFTKEHPQQLLAPTKQEFSSVFQRLHPFPLSLPELVSLVSGQLIHILSYRLIAHPLSPGQLKP